MRLPGGGRSKVDELGGQEGRLSVDERDRSSEAQGRIHVEGDEGEAGARNLHRVEQREALRRDCRRQFAGRGQDERLLGHEAAAIALHRLSDRGGPRSGRRRWAPAAVVRGRVPDDPRGRRDLAGRVDEAGVIGGVRRPHDVRDDACERRDHSFEPFEGVVDGSERHIGQLSRHAPSP